MFNIGSFEVLLIFIIALLVLGPERLPGAVRTTGLWIGRFRRSFYKVKNEIERELNADEIRRQLHNETVMAEIEDAKSNIEGVAKDTEKSVNNIVNSANFDPGASQASLDAAKKNSEDESAAVESLAKNDKSLTGELKDMSNQVEEVTKQIYSGGKNPKLADPGDSTDNSTDSLDTKKENGNS
ncbi:MAG: sec-independent protein translocase protein TatB [Kiritimatiellia bacterium]|jgi:sec-independent protein translocase protein TatB